MKQYLHGYRRLIISLFAGITLMLSLQNSVYAEGTKQVRPDSTISAAALMIDWNDPLFTRFCMVGCAPNYRLNIHIKNVNEVILFGLKTPYTSIGWALKKPDGTIAAGMSGLDYPMAGAGYIQYYRQATRGPFPGIGGYTPKQFKADMVGDWYFELTDVHIDPGYPVGWGPTGIFDLWDFQVVNGLNDPALPTDTLNGRVWSQSWQMYAKVETPNLRYYNGSLYVYTNDGIVTKLVSNGMGMGEGTFFCNETGCLNTSNFTLDRQSKNSNTSSIFPAIAQYKVFLNNPDITVYPDGTYGQLNSVNYFNDPNEPCSWNKYFIINVNKAGQVVIKIDIPYGDPSYDIQILANVVPGDNTIPWNGLDGHGNPVPNGTILTFTVDYLNGLTNLPLWDFEGNPNGFKVYPVRPIGPGLNPPMLYWDDSQLTAVGGTSTSCSNPPNTVNLTGCTPASSTCHDWPVTCHNKMVNTWWYSGSTTTLPLEIAFNVQPKPTIQGPAPVCSNTNGCVYTTEAGMANYNWLISAGGTIVAGGGINDNYVTVNWGVAGARSVTVTYTGTNGCPSLVTIYAVVVADTFVPGVTITASGNPVCPGTMVTFTANPTNGGVSPSYQWKVGGINQGTNSPTFTYIPLNNDVITCVLTTSLSCAIPKKGTSNSITMSVRTPINPVITIAASQNPICAGDPVTFTATVTNGGASPSFQWEVEGVNVGTNSPTYLYYPADNDNIRCRVTSSLNCASGPVWSTLINMTVRSRPMPTLTGPPSVCAGSTGNVYTTDGSKTNYTWVVSAGGTITAGGGTNNRTVTVTWNTAGAQWVSVNYNTIGNPCFGITPTIVDVTVNLRPIPTISGPASACVGSTGNVYTTEAGMSAYTWALPAGGGTIISGAGTRSITVTWNTAGARTVSVFYTNTFGCTTVTPTIFNVNVNNNLPVSVSIAASANPVCAGTAVTYTATPTNGGSAPSYQWKVNGSVQGANSPTLTFTPVNGDKITCILTSNLGCTLGGTNPATSNMITMVVNPLLPVSVSIAASANPVCSGSSVTFTATPTNGGAAPFYQWKVNGVNQGSNSPTYTYAPVNGQIITCVLTSNAVCPTGNPAISNSISMVVNPFLPVSVSITASVNPVCAGTSVTFTATPTNGGTTPSYQWKVNGSNVGANSSTYSYTPANGDAVTCVLTSIATCPTGNPATSNTITMTVNPASPVSVSIAASANPVCAGTSVTFTATPTNGGTTPSYQWKVNGVNVGVNSTTYSYAPVNGDAITCVLTSNATCPTGNPATSNTITMTVNPLLPVSVSIAASANPICAGTSVTFTATPTNGGTTPSYQWKVNGSNVGTNSSTYTYVPVNGQIITCVLTSNATCPTGNPATSNTITMTVNPLLPVSVSIAASTNPVCAGTSVTFTATPTNGGTTPSYQWKVNGSNAGTNSPTYSYTPANGDAITCVLTSNATCPTGNPATSNTITMTVNPLLPVSVSIAASANPVCAGTSVTFTATPTNGGTTPSYQWKVNGSNVGANSSTYSYTPANGDAVTCVLTSNATCPTGNPATSNTITMTVNPLLPVSVSIAASANPICAGTSVTFTATPTNGGTTPSYQWKVNGVNVGANSSTYSYTPVNGDAITCVLTSNATCPTGNPATSNTITMTVNPLLPVSVSIAASANPVCAGTSVTFTATPTNGGTTPSYQWKVNGINAGTNSSTYSYTPANGDAVTCVLTSNATCPTGNPATSNTITMTVNGLTVITGQPSNIAVIQGGNTSFSVSATGIGLTYQWQVNTGSGWNNVSNGGVYSGATSNTLTITGATAGMNGYQYRCVVTGTCGMVISDAAILTVYSPPDIVCPVDINTTTDPGLCSAALNPGFPTLVSGTIPVTYTWVMTGATTGSGSGAIIPNPYTFNIGTTTITWRATNIAGFDECTQTITVTDSQPPTFTAPPSQSFCVEDIYSGIYWDPTMDIAPDRPEYYLFKSGDTYLNLNTASFADNCPLNCGAEIRWRISFSGGTFLPALPALYNTGQPSAYLSNIQFPGSVTINVIHTITYQIVDCNGVVSLPVTVNITITPRPNVIKQP